MLFLALLAATWFISWQRLESERELVNRNSSVRQESLASIIAENLGLITPPVEALRKQFEFPGMRVMQFAFDQDPANPHLPDPPCPRT